MFLKSSYTKFLTRVLQIVVKNWDEKQNKNEKTLSPTLFALNISTLKL